MRKRAIWLAAAFAAGSILLPTAAQAAPVQAASKQPLPGASEGLTPEQIATINALETAKPVSGAAMKAPAKSDGNKVALAATVYTRRASYYQGSVLMWTRDNIDFGFDFSRVNWSSGFQQSGWIWPNISRNDGISRYLTNVQNHRWRAKNSFGAGVPTPWGDVKVYNLTYTTDGNVTYNGAWQMQRS